MADILCPVCGKIGEEEMSLEDASLRRQAFIMSPIVPFCRNCGSRVLVSWESRPIRVIILSGTCGSGKSSVAEYLHKHMGLWVIDGDCAIQAAKARYGVQKPSRELIYLEIADEIRLLVSLHRDIVLSHVIEPEDITRYTNLMEALDLRWRYFLLQPSFETALARTRERTCHASVTPEEWVRHYYDRLFQPAEAAGPVRVYDNTAETVGETARKIWEESAFKETNT